MIRLLTMLFLLGGCAVAPLVPGVESTDSVNGRLIQLSPGWNCHAENCILLDPIRRTVQSPEAPSRPVRLPLRFEIADGSVTEAEFAYLVRLARFGGGGRGTN